MPKKYPQNFFIAGQASIDAEATVEAGDASSPKIILLANAGSPMDLFGYEYPVVVDMKGARFDKSSTPIIMDHNTTMRIGHTTNQTIDPMTATIRAEGVKSSQMGVADGFVKDAKAGFPFQVSIGAKMLKGYIVPEKESVFINNRAYQGPLIVSSETLIRELSVTVLGADNQTYALVAGANQDSQISLLTKEHAMDFEAYVKALGFELSQLTEEQKTKMEAKWKKEHTPPPAPPATPTPPPTPPEDPILAMNRLQAANSRRINAINAAAAGVPEDTEFDVNGRKIKINEFVAHAIETNMDARDFELATLRASRPQAQGPAIHRVPDVLGLGNQVFTCALVRNSGVVPARRLNAGNGNEWGYEVDFPEEVLEASDHRSLKNMGLHQMIDYAIMAATGFPYTGNRKSDDFLAAGRQAIRKLQAAAGFTTLDITQIFDDVANKLLWAGYQGVQTTWEMLARVVSVNDFKPQYFYRMNTHGAYQKIGQDGELKEGRFSDVKYQVEAETYGKITQMTRKNLINDDMGVFNSIMTDLGLEGAKTIEELVYLELMGNLATIFPTNGSLNNYISGATTALSLAGLALAETKFINQVDADNSPILVNPDRILVGSPLKTTSNNLYNQTIMPPVGGVDPVEQSFQNNPYAGTYRPIVSPFLNNTLIKQRVDPQNLGTAIPGQSDTLWFMLCDPNLPQGALLMVALLNGNRTPFLEQADADFSVLGMRWRAYHDVGTGQGEPTLGVMSKGAA